MIKAGKSRGKCKSTTTTDHLKLMCTADESKLTNITPVVTFEGHDDAVRCIFVTENDEVLTGYPLHQHPHTTVPLCLVESCLCVDMIAESAHAAARTIILRGNGICMATASRASQATMAQSPRFVAATSMYSQDRWVRRPYTAGLILRQEDTLAMMWPLAEFNALHEEVKALLGCAGWCSYGAGLAGRA